MLRVAAAVAAAVALLPAPSSAGEAQEKPDRGIWGAERDASFEGWSADEYQEEMDIVRPVVNQLRCSMCQLLVGDLLQAATGMEAVHKTGGKYQRMIGTELAPTLAV